MAISAQTSGQTSGQKSPLFEADGPLIWVVSDGTAGMVSQALGLAQAMDVPYFDVRIFASPIYRFFPQMGRWPTMPISPRRSDRRIGPPWPDVIITCGKRTTGASLAIKRLSGGKTKIVQIQDPRIKPSYFDVLVVPQHDPVSQTGAPNLVISKGSLNRLTMTQIATEAKALDRRYKKSRLPQTAVMIGGSNRRYQASLSDFAALGERLRDFAVKQGRHLVLIGSRRTSDKALAAISEALGRVSHSIWDGKGANPYPGILGVADDVIVTSDSVNMTSEACLTGKAVYVAELRPETGRIAAFHQMMQKQGYTKALGDSFDRQPEILDEMPNIARQVREKLGL
ncbi:MAG: mitochondrial fission ELM1 family protein [Candidatus Puniceispirillaceae bacterium]